MILCKVKNLKGGEILAKTIMTPGFRILLSEDTILRPEYIKKIEELGITEVYIKGNEHIPMQEVVLIKSEVETLLKNEVKSILEKHTYSRTDELMELKKTAENIIENILKYH